MKTHWTWGQPAGGMTSTRMVCLCGRKLDSEKVVMAPELATGWTPEVLGDNWSDLCWTCWAVWDKADAEARPWDHLMWEFKR